MTATPTAIITGGAAGIGYAIATAFAQQGYQIAIVDRDPALVDNAAQLLTQDTGEKIISAVADVANAEQCESAYKNIEDEFGTVAVLVNNAGIMPPVKGRIEELPADDFQHMMNVHLGGTVNWCRLVIPGMREARFGRIINMSSVNAVQPVPYRSAYVTAKKAIRGLTEALALECARAGITVNAIAPGYILTDTLKERAERGLIDHDAIAAKTPVGRWGDPHEIAHAALFLAAAESAYITGTTLSIDGGLPLRGDADENLVDSPYPG